MKPCETCGGIWWWSEWRYEGFRCCKCSPPAEGQRVLAGPGLIVDGQLVSSDTIDQDIEMTAAAVQCADLAHLLPGWVPVPVFERRLPVYHAPAPANPDMTGCPDEILDTRPRTVTKPEPAPKVEPAPTLEERFKEAAQKSAKKRLTNRKRGS